MSNRTRLPVAAIVLAAGAAAARMIPAGMCPMGGRLDQKADGGYWCHVSDVGYSARSLVAVKIGMAVVAIVAAAVLALPVLSRWAARPW